MTKHDPKNEELINQWNWLPGERNKPAFLFIHGFATSPLDLIPLAKSFHDAGFSVCLPWLKGHNGGPEALEKTRFADWQKQIRNNYSDLINKGFRVYVIGFSLGGVLGVDLATYENVSGVLSISTFFKPSSSRLVRIGLRLAKILPKFRLKRVLQTTDKKTRDELMAMPYLPVETAETVIREAGFLASRIRTLSCPSLFLHSLEDRIASYDAVARYVKDNPTGECRLVTLRGLNHFVQFDVQPNAIRDMTLEWFGLPIPGSSGISPNDLLAEQFEQRTQESRHWSGILFQLVVGFFVAFGFLLLETFGKVLDGDPGSAPYYILFYVFAIGLYIQLISLYFFYMNRVDAHLKQHIEPLVRGSPWTYMRTNRWATGILSNIMTKSITIPTVVLPLCGGLGALIYCAFRYAERFFVFCPENAFVQILFLISAFMWIAGARALIKLNIYTNNETYRVAAPIYSTPAMEDRINRLYVSISPGSVRQPIVTSVTSSKSSKARRVPQDNSSSNV